MFHVISCRNLPWYADQSLFDVISSQDYILQLCKKLKLYTQNWVQKRSISIHIRIYFWWIVDYHHLKMCFYNSTSHQTTTSSVKSISEAILSGTIKCPYFDTIVLPTLKKVKRFQTRRIDGFASSCYFTEKC